jgi:hypothetical protein
MKIRPDLVKKRGGNFGRGIDESRSPNRGVHVLYLCCKVVFDGLEMLVDGVFRKVQRRSSPEMHKVGLWEKFIRRCATAEKMRISFEIEKGELFDVV